MNYLRVLLVVSLAMFPVCAAQAQRSPVRQSFDLRVPWSPVPVIVSGKPSLVYELYFTNYASAPLSVSRLEVVDDQHHVLVDLSGVRLRDAFGSVGRVQGDDRLRVNSGMTAVAYLSVPLARVGTTHLQHRVTYSGPDASNVSVTGGGLTSRMPASKPLGPPLRGGPWVAIYNEGWERGHRRVLYATDGRVQIPGRFAIDWIRVGEHGGFAGGNANVPAQWLGYGADVLAVADATVASVGVGIAEPASIAQGMSRKLPLEADAGNYVALDLGDGRFAFYEHLKPGSIKVKPGQHVKRGVVIGQLGFTGQSTGPHLHFHVSDANVPLAAEGLPYSLERFAVLGSYSSLADFSEGRAWNRVATPEFGEGFPAPLIVVEFSDTQ